jgi:hypothetical protein
MYTNHRMYQNISEQAADHTRSNQDHLRIKKIDRIYDRHRNQLILMVSAGEMLDREVNVFLEDNSLVLEAPHQLEYNKPFRTHLMDKDPLYEAENEDSTIGFSEVKLKPGYHYSVLSYQLINPTLIKIILKSSVALHQSNRSQTLKNKRRK